MNSIPDSIPQEYRYDIQAFLRSKPYTYRDILQANYYDIYDGAKARGLCSHLARKCSYRGINALKNEQALKIICMATGLTRQHALKTIQASRMPDIPMDFNRQRHEYA